MKCSSCGGDNAAASARCQYCDQSLAARQAVDVAWLGQAGGAVGRGHLQGSVPAGTDGAARLRAAAESAFAAAVAEVGAHAPREELAAAMRARLASAGHDGVTSLTVDSVAHGAAGPRPAGSGCAPRAACLFVLAALGGCCLLFGTVGLLAGQDHAERAAAIEGATVVTPAEAARKPGVLVVLEGQVATVTSPVQVSGSPSGLIYVEETERRTTQREHKRTVREGGRTRTETWTSDESRSDVRKKLADGLRLGGLPVAAGAEWDQLQPLEELKHEEERVSLTYVGVPVGAKLTAVGVVRADGTLGKGAAGEPFLLSTRGSRAELVGSLRTQASEMRKFSIVSLVTSLLVFGAIAAVLLASRRT